MIKKDNFRFLSNYTIAANLMFITVAIGVFNIFLHGIDDLFDTLIAFAIVILRYISFVLIKRRFNWSRYLLWILLARSIYRIYFVYHLPSAGDIYFITTIIQFLLTSLSLYLVYFPNNQKRF